MLHKPLIACLFCAAFVANGRAEDKPKLPVGSPPRLVIVVEVKGDILIYRDFASWPPELPKVPASMLAYSVNFSFKEGTILDTEGKKLDAEAAKKRLLAGAVALVSTSGKKVDPAYLRILKKETLILVEPLPGPGPPLPGGGE